MAFTYILLNLVFLACVLGLFAQHLVKPTKTWWITFAVLIVLTALFDSIIIWAGIVGYDTTKILGLYVGYAPIEDFFYAILAVILVPTLWNMFDGKKWGENK
jgi:lycopene cyclase domain-containing protein